MVAGGAKHWWLERMAAIRPISMHGVGMSLGSADGIGAAHLARLKALVQRYDPALVSEHLSWSRAGGVFVPDLLPLPLTREALQVMSENVDAMQTALKRQILVENPSTYIDFAARDFDEPAFMAELCGQAGCGWLLDVNNVVVSSTNHGLDAAAYIDAVDGALVGEIHLAGHTVEQHGSPLLVDDHGSAVGDTTLQLYDRLIARIGVRPTLVEWDTSVPAWPVLRAEADRVDARLAAMEYCRAA